MMFDDLTYARAIMADRERAASRGRFAGQARAARAAAACCESRVRGLFQLLMGGRRVAPESTCAAC